MASGVTGKKTARKGASSAGNHTNSRKTAGKSSTSGAKNTADRSNTGSSRGTAETNNTAGKNNTAAGKKDGNSIFQEVEHKGLGDEIRFFIAFGITILLTMCNFHYCMGVGNAVYFILHGLFGWPAYVLPFILLGIYLFMLPNRGNEEAAAKTKLCLILFIECCWLFHFIGISDSQPFSPIYYFTAGQSGINGGLVGGLFSGLLQHLIGTAATVLILFLLLLITVIILTEQSAVQTMRKFAGSFQSLSFGGFRILKKRFQALFYVDEEEDDYEYNYETDEENYTQAGDESEYESPEKTDEVTGDSYSGAKSRSFVWDWKASGTDRKQSEFFTQKFPFMNDEKKPEKEKKESEKSRSMRDTSNRKHEDKGTDSAFFDQNWRKGFSSGSGNTGSSAGQPKRESSGFVHTASRNGRPGSASTRILHDRDSRSLTEMGFADLLEESPHVTGSIDDFIVYNGIMQTAGAAVSQEDTYTDTDESEETAGFHDYTGPDEISGSCDQTKSVETADFYDQKDSSETTASCEQTDTHEASGFCEQMVADEVKPAEHAVDITEHVVLPEDGPVMRNFTDMESASISEKAPVTGKALNSDSSIWKKNTGSGSRESSGAVTFSSKPVPPVKKTVVKKPYAFPPASLLKRNSAFNGGLNRTHKEIQQKLNDTLQSFGVKVNMGMISVGPAVTRYELEPEPGVKVSRIVALQDDIKLALAAPDIRIEAPIPGKSAIGIEVPNQENTVVGFRELIEAETFQKHPSRVAVAVGRDIGGQIIVADLAKMPHLLIAGATGSGKSVCINTLIMSIIYKATPEEVKLVMVDPKVVELSIYNGIPHLLVPVVTDARKAANALRWAVDEMNDRYKKFADYNVRNIEGYNEHLRIEKSKDPSNDEPYLYQMVIIVDELADLMMVAQGEVEEAICRLAQMARAAGIHLVLATQRPSVNVITGLIKANVPSRIAFAVSSGVDSRTIIDMNGAEKLLGKGDMLFYPYGLPKPVRVQGAFISDEEVSRVVNWLHKNNGEISGQEMMEKMITSASENAAVKTERDEYFESAARFIIEKDKASIGALQRNFKIGFNRAARIMDQLAAAGVVGEEDGTKPRKILMNMDEFNQYMEG